MLRRLFSSNLKTLNTISHLRSAPSAADPYAAATFRFSPATTTTTPLSSLNRFLTTQSDGSIKKSVEDVLPIATGHEREEFQAQLEGRDILEINHPEGPFGTKEAPAVVKSYYDRRIVGCPGGEDEDEHDVVWFWLEKGKPYECPVCQQYFELEVVGPGGDPYGHGDQDDEHH